MIDHVEKVRWSLLPWSFLQTGTRFGLCNVYRLPSDSMLVILRTARRRLKLNYPANRSLQELFFVFKLLRYVNSIVRYSHLSAAVEGPQMEMVCQENNAVWRHCRASLSTTKWLIMLRRCDKASFPDASSKRARALVYGKSTTFRKLLCSLSREPR